ncbi:MAG: hypothetical protein WD991_01465 [Candidatus Paceibacterota bacterium]
MSHTQYLKLIEREIQRINKKIDMKIMRGEDYREEAKDHKILLRRMRYHTRPSLTQRMIHLFFRKDISIYA